VKLTKAEIEGCRADLLAGIALSRADKIALCDQALRAEELERDAMRYRHLRDHYGHHLPMTETQPAEWSISWEFQQSTPQERHGTFDFIIDRDIARWAAEDARDAAIDRALGEKP
jgi:hypothetical protein